MERAADLLSKAEISCILYETPRAIDGERWRCVSPLSEPIAVADRRLFVGRLNAVLEGALAKESEEDRRWWFAGALVGTRPRRMIEVE